ncbi:MAG: hypothetical protein ACJ75B_14275 [Flavisolibacter sp.]
MADLLSAISVFLVFLTFLLQIVDRDISAMIKESNPFQDKINDKKVFRKRLFKALFLKSIPITLIYLITAYSLLPKVVYLIKYGKIDLWNFDPLNTLFIFIQFGVTALFIYSAYKMAELIRKIRSVK